MTTEWRSPLVRTACREPARAYREFGAAPAHIPGHEGTNDRGHVLRRVGAPDRVLELADEFRIDTERVATCALTRHAASMCRDMKMLTTPTLRRDTYAHKTALQCRDTLAMVNATGCRDTLNALTQTSTAISSHKAQEKS